MRTGGVTSEPHLSECVAWPEAVRVLDHAVALRAVRDGRLAVYLFKGRRL